jgi:hypothetical protein
VEAQLACCNFQLRLFATGILGFKGEKKACVCLPTTVYLFVQTEKKRLVGLVEECMYNTKNGVCLINVFVVLVFVLRGPLFL